MATILEALRNAEINLKNARRGLFLSTLYDLGCEQLHNAVELLDKGYDLNNKIAPLLEKHGGIDKVPEKEVPK